jgi:hypothetical protein
MYDINDDEEFILDDERGIVVSRKVFSRERWAEIARSIPLDEIPYEMKREIKALWIRAVLAILTPKTPKKASQRPALKKLVNYLKKPKARISKLQRELSSEQIVGSINELLEQIEIVRTAGDTMLAQRKSKGGRPRKIERTQLAYDLLDIYTKYTGKPIGLSRDAFNRPSGPCYRFLSAIFRGWISTTGLEDVIIAKRDMVKTTSQNIHS